MCTATKLTTAALAALTVASINANAALLLGPPGMPPTGWTATGALVASLDSGPIADDLGSFTAQLKSWVYSGDTANPFSGLTFVYQFTNIDAATGDTDLASLALRYGPTAPIAVEQSLEPSNLAALAQCVHNPTFTVVNFFFIGDTVEVNSTSPYLVVHTDMPRWVEGNAGISGGTTEDFPALIPVPEPSFFAGVFALGLAGFAAWRRCSA